MVAGIGDVFKSMPGLNMISSAMTLIEGIKSGDMSKIMSSVSSLALTFATGGAGAMFGALMPMLQSMGSNVMSTALTGAFGMEAGMGAIQKLGSEMGISQSGIDAAQAIFAEKMGDSKTARKEFRNAGMGSYINRHERAQANDFFSMVQKEAKGGQFFFGPMGANILAGPNASPAQLGRAQNLFGSLMNNLMGSLITNVLGGMAAQSTSSQDLGNLLINDRIGADAESIGPKRKPGELGAQLMSELGISGGGFLLKFAILLGEVLDKKTDEMMRIADKMNQEADKVGALDGNTMKKKGGLGGLFGGKEVNQDKQNDFNKSMQESNSRMQTLGAMLNGIGKEMDALQTALKTALDSVGGSQKNLASGR